ncbi:hypothetical protein PICMEDRAFT_177245 [Pichia membranifaciens NRRL Y-2026]|uniref:Uncharacterized protein n=1 Tax=Pichia membranifaciens NRRL Y-2026 TaxID=763406 RepID=A0A1E3NFC8_9ASCO|nr:hypothetical protein PICMEDRAFT_177245 [Pichia membranifaciens NRRL Y-2026]ODQ44796.1 hypothetical protein PICMEDRAFT_177245 [Pichia membranifaciens NRRL Y-2026]
MGSGAERSSKSRRTQRSTEAPKHRSKKPGMKKTGKRKPYFKPLFKVNASKSEDVEKQSQLMLENHKKLTNSTTTTTTKDGLRRNHAKPKKNQYVLVHSFLDDNDVEPTEERAAAKVGGHGHLHHPFDMDLGFNRGVGGVRRSSSCKSFASADHADSETAVSSSSMATSASNGLTNLFKKSLKRNSTHEENNAAMLGNSLSSEGLASMKEVADDVGGPLQFDPFVGSAVGLSSHTQMQAQPHVQPEPESDAVEKQHRPSGFRKFYTTNKAKSKSKLMGRVKPRTEQPDPEAAEQEQALKPITPVQQSQHAFPPQSYDYFGITKATRNRSTSSSSSSFLRQQQAQQQQSFLADDSFLYTPSTMATPNDTPLGTPYESYEDVVTPSRTPTTMDDESNLEVCSINTSSTKRFKALKRSSSIMSLNSSLSMQLATPMTTTQGGTPIPASPLVSSISNPGTRSAINIGAAVYPSITTPAVGSRARIWSCSSTASIGHPHLVQKSPSNSNIGAKAIYQQQQQQQFPQQQSQQQFQQHQPSLTRSKSHTTQPQLQLHLQPPPQPIPTQHFPLQASPAPSFPPSYKSPSVMAHSPYQQPFVRSPMTGDVPAGCRNGQPAKSSINLDSYLHYIDESKARAPNPPEFSQQEALNFGMNLNGDRSGPPSRAPQPAQAAFRIQTHQYQHPHQQQPFVHPHHQSPTQTHPFVHHQAIPQMPHVPQQQQIHHGTDSTAHRLQNMIDCQQQQILRQQLHHNDPQVLHNLQALNELDDQLNQLEGLDELNNSSSSNKLPVDTLDGMENIDDSRIMDNMLNEELDQLINITRLEALAKEIEEFGTHSAASVVLPRQSRGPGDYPGDYPGFPVYHPQ